MKLFRIKGGPRMSSSPLTAATLRAIYDSVENDPTAGLGSISKPDLLIDKILAHVRITAPPPQIAQAPLLSDPPLLLTNKQAA
jgi:hypothetical protein